MSYPTVGYPEWTSLSPKVHDADVPEFVQQVSRSTRDLFDENHDVHRPERDAIGYCKRRAVYAAVAIEAEADSMQILDVVEAIGVDTTRLVENDLGGEVVEPVDVALAAYAEIVWRRDWAEKRTDLDPQSFIFLHDHGQDFEERGRELWEER